MFLILISQNDSLVRISSPLRLILYELSHSFASVSSTWDNSDSNCTEIGIIFSSSDNEFFNSLNNLSSA